MAARSSPKSRMGWERERSISRTWAGRVGTSMVEARLRASRSRRRERWAFWAAWESDVSVRYSTVSDAMVDVVFMGK